VLPPLPSRRLRRAAVSRRLDHLTTPSTRVWGSEGGAFRTSVPPAQLINLSHPTPQGTPPTPGSAPSPSPPTRHRIPRVGLACSSLGFVAGMTTKARTGFFGCTADRHNNARVAFCAGLEGSPGARRCKYDRPRTVAICYIHQISTKKRRTSRRRMMGFNPETVRNNQNRPRVRDLSIGKAAPIPR
jgi:hypothetical protein